MTVCWEVARFSLLKECPRSKSFLALMRASVSALIPPPNCRGGRTSLDKSDELPVVQPVRCMAPDFKIFRESSPRLVYNPECEATFL